jgi:hypothetical protein
MEKPFENKLNTVVGNSGNSDVDLVVNIDIDTNAIAYAVLCSLYAKGEINDLELEKAIKKLDSLIERDKGNRKSKSNTTIIDNNRNLFDFPRRRNWF